MKKGIINLLLVAVVGGSASYTAFGRDTLVKPSIACADAGQGDKVRRVLIVGESWASKGRLLPELPIAVARRSNERVRACSIGYSGQNSAKVRAQFDPRQAVEQLGGAPDNFVVLLGVNDQIQHRGAEFFSDNINTLAKTFPQATVQAVSAPIISLTPPLALPNRVKNRMAGWFNSDVNGDYYAALVTRLGAGRVIDFKQFSAGYPAEKQRFAKDGIHFTTTGYHAYGRFIGEQLDLPEAP